MYYRIPENEGTIKEGMDANFWYIERSVLPYSSSCLERNRNTALKRRPSLPMFSFEI